MTKLEFEVFFLHVLHRKSLFALSVRVVVCLLLRMRNLLKFFYVIGNVYLLERTTLKRYQKKTFLKFALFTPF
jgi:hypothetical protein